MATPKKPAATPAAAPKKAAATTEESSVPAIIQPEASSALALSDKFRTDENGKKYIDIEFEITPEGDITGDNTPMQLAIMKLLQGISGEISRDEIEGATPGQWYNTGTLELSEGGKFIPLFRYDERYRNQDPTNINSPLVCSSREGSGKWGSCSLDVANMYGIPMKKITAPNESGVVSEAIVGDCSMCPNAQFGRDANNQPTRPPCRHVTWLVCIPEALVEFNEAFVQKLVNADPDDILEITSNFAAIPLGGSARTLWDKTIHPAMRRAGSVFGVLWSVGRRMEQKPKGKFWYPTFKPVRLFTAEERVVLRSLSKLIEKMRPVLTKYLNEKISSIDLDNVPEGGAGTVIFE